MQQFVRIHVSTGRFACHSCLGEFKENERYLEIDDWCRMLCLPCARTLGEKMRQIAELYIAEEKPAAEADLF